MNIDVIRENITLPPLKRDDHVVVHTVGAYNMTQWMQFITLRPAIVMIDLDEKAHIIRNRETLNSIQGDEVLPTYLKKFQLNCGRKNKEPYQLFSRRHFRKLQSDIFLK